MSWLRLDDGFTKHPKFEGWTVAQRWAWLELMEYCARYETGGRIPTDLTLLPKSATKALLARAEVSKWCRRGPDGALWINDFEVYNPPREGVDEAVSEYLIAHPEASANEVAKALGGTRKRVLKAVARYRSGSASGSETGTESDPDRYGSGYTRARVPAPASPSRPVPSLEPLNQEPAPKPEPQLQDPAREAPNGAGAGSGELERLDPAAALRAATADDELPF